MSEMTEGARPVAWYRSIFVRQLAIMLITTASLAFFVGFFFYAILGPNLSIVPRVW